MSQYKIIAAHLSKTIQQDGETIVQIEIDYPVITETNESVPLQVSQYLRQAAENIAESALEDIIGEAKSIHSAKRSIFKPFQVIINFTVTYNENDVLSLYNEQTTNAGGLNCCIYRCSSSWDMLSGDPLSIDNFFIKTYQTRKIVTSYVASKLCNVMQPESALALVLHHYSPDNFYLTESGLAVFFQTHTISPGSSGIPVFIIPYNDTGPLSPPNRIMPGDSRVVAPTPVSPSSWYMGTRGSIQLHKDLKLLGFVPDDTRVVDEKSAAEIDEKNAAAIKNIQKQMGITPSGEVCPATYDVMSFLMRHLPAVEAREE